MANLREWLEQARQVSPGPLIGGLMPSDRTLREFVEPEPGTVYGDVLPAARLRDDETAPANDRWPFKEIRPAVPGVLRDFARAVRFPYDYAHSDMDPTSPEVVTRATETALSLMGGGAFMRAPANSLRMFAGRNAKTADLGALERAQMMEANGLDRDAIWSETGWFKGVDGQWRFEIDDSAANLVTDKTVPAEKEVWSQFFNSDNGDWHAEMLMSHDDLFKAYPDAKYTPTAKMPPEMWAAGAFDPNTGRIFLQEPAATGVPLKSLFLHELQHGLQRKENFSPGSIPNAKTKSDYWNSAGEVEARNVQTRANMTPEQRRATPPWDTQDVPDADQIVRRDYIGPAASYPTDAPLRAPELPAATTPAEQQARDILEMLRSGRASEVTDEMMAAADPQYLFRNYDLPMDEASRMARAKEMGFDTDTPLYHGTRQDFSAFDPGRIGSATDAGHYGSGHYFANTPGEAEFYGTFINNALVRGKYLDLGNNSGDFTFDGHFKSWAPKLDEIEALTPDQRKAYDAISAADKYVNENVRFLSAVSRDGAEGWLAKVPNPASGYTDDIMTRPFRDQFDQSKEDALKNLRSRFRAEMERFHPDVYPGLGSQHASLSDYVRTELTPGRLTEKAKAHSYDGIVYGDETIVFDPANIRSRFARFDPRLSHLRNLNAANAAPEMALLPGAGEALRPELAAAQEDPMEAEIRRYLEAVMRGEAE